MKLKNVLIALPLFGLLFSPVQAQEKLTLKSSKITISGNSTMHKWSSKATDVSMSADVVIEDGVVKNISSGKVVIKTASLKSHNDSDLMDSRTHETLKAEKYPTINYSFEKLLSADAQGNCKIQGKLTLAGVTKPLNLDIKISTIGGNVTIVGSKSFTMSSFGVKPPSFLAGTLKVDDLVAIDFEVVLKQ